MGEQTSFFNNDQGKSGWASANPAHPAPMSLYLQKRAGEVTAEHEQKYADIRAHKSVRIDQGSHSAPR